MHPNSAAVTYWYEIVEVYYDKNTKEPVNYCEPHMHFDSPSDFAETLEMMKSALDKPVLKAHNLKPV
jgi:hypothetical protein